MTKKRSQVAAVRPTVEDIRAALYYVRVESEAIEYPLKGKQLTGHMAKLYRLGAAVLVRYNLILTPPFKHGDPISESYEVLYSRVVSGPLITFEEDEGRRRLVGLVLRDTPGRPINQLWLEK